eukprot:6205251-Pleurochrysis_carterae.AAC.1
MQEHDAFHSSPESDHLFVHTMHGMPQPWSHAHITTVSAFRFLRRQLSHWKNASRLSRTARTDRCNCTTKHGASARACIMPYMH